MVRVALPLRLALVIVVLVAAGCHRGGTTREYPITGVVLGVDADRRQILLRHEEIPGFMAAMTMPFAVRERALLDGRAPGDLITATLVVEETDGGIEVYLTALTATGRVALDEAAPAAFPASIVLPGEPVPDVALVDAHGADLRLSDLRGHRVAVTFIYTRCPFPEYCPLLDRHFATLQAAIAADPALADVRLLSITIDPSYDTPAVLAAHAARLEARPAIWTFATGEPDAIDAFAGRLGLHVEQRGPDPFDIVHSLRTVVIDASGRLARAYGGNSWTPSELLADLAALTPAP